MWIFPSFITLDFSPVPADVINEKLVAAAMNNEKSISEEEEAKRKKEYHCIRTFLRKSREKKDEIEGYMDLVNDNDETGFFLNFLFVATAADETTLAQRVEQLKETGKAQGVVISTADYTQLKALNTALPFSRTAGRLHAFLSIFLNGCDAAILCPGYFRPRRIFLWVEPHDKTIDIRKQETADEPLMQSLLDTRVLVSRCLSRQQRYSRHLSPHQMIF